ncbi:hypothetical protein PM082_024655 [Marasmius tenuissimus]|nr:hypothetical protein PM082_024655 [Marasmius tenuissimus]
MEIEDISRLSDSEEDIQLSSPPVSKPRESQRKRSTKPNKPGKVAEDFKLTNTLKVPRATTYAASALNEQIIRGDIELNPEYQRDVVWSAQKQIGLIDSIFRNFYVPPVIFSVTCNDDGSETKICIDGKQRLTSIHLFMTGVIPHRDAETGQQYWFVKDPKDKKELLPEKYRSIFSNKQIVCVEYQDLKDTDERDIFTRVQLGMALTVAEKLQAISTPRADLIRRLMEKFITPDTLAHPDVAWDRTRARDFQIIGNVIYYLFKWEKHSGVKTWISTSVLETWLSEPESTRRRRDDPKSQKDVDGKSSQRKGVPVDEEFAATVTKTFKMVAEMATMRRYNAPFRASKSIGPKVSPIEMVGVFILVYAVYTSPPKASKKEVSPAGLAALFVLLRKKLREEHTDVRSNPKVGRTMFDFCLDAAKDPIGTLREGEDAGLLEGEVEEEAKWMQVKKPGGPGVKKPKPKPRQPEEDDSSDEGERVQTSKWEEEEKTVPAKRRRSTGRHSALHPSPKSSLASAKRRKSEPASRRPGLESASDDEPRSAPIRRSVMSHVSLPAHTPSRKVRRSRRLSPDDEAGSGSEDRAVNAQSSTLTPLSPETSPQFALPSPLPSGSPSEDADQGNDNDAPDLPQNTAGSSASTIIAPSLPGPTAEQLLAAMGVSVPPEMIPLMMAQMKLLAQGGAQTLPQLPFMPSLQTTLPAPYDDPGQHAEVKDEITGASDSAQENLFAVNLAQGIQGAAYHTDT